MEFKHLLGFVAMLLVQGSTLFQVFKFIKTKRIEGVSIGFWITVDMGLVCYFFYAIIIKDPIYIISNAIGIILTTWSILLYYHYRRKNGNG